MIYLCSPYSHDDPEVRRQRFEAVRRYAADLIQAGQLVFCPIAYSHQFAAEFRDVCPRWDYWKKFDLRMISICSLVAVLKLPGWEASVGVSAEVEFARSLGIPVVYLEWGE